MLGKSQHMGDVHLSAVGPASDGFPSVIVLHSGVSTDSELEVPNLQSIQRKLLVFQKCGPWRILAH